MEKEKRIVSLCKKLGCCDACCLRYLGLKNHNFYEDPHKYLLKYEDNPSEPQEPTDNPPTEIKNGTSASPERDTHAKNGTSNATEGSLDVNNGTSVQDGDSPPHKRRKLETCVSCLGILQEASWGECCHMVKEVMDKKGYECSTFACALSAPIATLLREKAITLTLSEAVPDYDPRCLTALKEAWKCRAGRRLSEHLGKELHSGAACPLLVTVTMDYRDELQELEILKTLASSLFESRSKQKRRFTVEFTRRSVEQALDGVTVSALQQLAGWGRGEVVPAAEVPARCVSATCVHTPVYWGGRYIKLSRSLPQTPWLVNGVRMAESSVQEVIFQPLAKLYRLTPEECDERLKLMSAGREDVDVRCLGHGRPFAIEVSDPHREISPEEMSLVCEEISRSGTVIVKALTPLTRDDLVVLKKGEESKCKTYEALCVKLERITLHDNTYRYEPVPVTADDISSVNSYRNTAAGEGARVVLTQRTPLRVLHRRPLLTRTRKLIHLAAQAVPDHPCLFVVRVRTEAGTYVKEWAHGDAGRTRPSLAAALACPNTGRTRVDMLALDVTTVDLDWPPGTTTTHVDNTPS